MKVLQIIATAATLSQTTAVSVNSEMGSGHTEQQWFAHLQQVGPMLFTELEQGESSSLKTIELGLCLGNPESYSINFQTCTELISTLVDHLQEDSISAQDDCPTHASPIDDDEHTTTVNNGTILALNTTIREKAREIQEQNKTIQEKAREIQEQQEKIEDKDREMIEMKQRIKYLERKIEQQEPEKPKKK